MAIVKMSELGGRGDACCQYHFLFIAVNIKSVANAMVKMIATTMLLIIMTMNRSMIRTLVVLAAFSDAGAQDRSQVAGLGKPQGLVGPRQRRSLASPHAQIACPRYLEKSLLWAEVSDMVFCMILKAPCTKTTIGSNCHKKNNNNHKTIPIFRRTTSSMVTCLVVMQAQRTRRRHVISCYRRQKLTLGISCHCSRSAQSVEQRSKEVFSSTCTLSISALLSFSEVLARCPLISLMVSSPCRCLSFHVLLVVCCRCSE